jgi:hypothetical protein
MDRFKPEALQPLPDLLPDCRETLSVKVHTDFAIRFDANTYSLPNVINLADRLVTRVEQSLSF